MAETPEQRLERLKKQQLDRRHAEINRANAEQARRLAGGSQDEPPDEDEVKPGEVDPVEELQIEVQLEAAALPPEATPTPEPTREVAKAKRMEPARILPYTDATSMNLPVDTTWEQYERMFRYVRVVDYGVHWYIGDLLLFADIRGKEWEEKSMQLAAELGWTPRRLTNCKSITRQYSSKPPFSGEPRLRERHDKLTFDMHAIVAYLDPPVSEELLVRAEVSRWNQEQLRDVAKLAKAKITPTQKEDRADEIAEVREAETAAAESKSNSYTTPPSDSWAEPEEDEGVGEIDAESEPEAEPIYDFAEHQELVSRVRDSIYGLYTVLMADTPETLEQSYQAVCSLVEPLLELRDSYERLGVGG